MLPHSRYLVVEEGQNSYNNISNQKGRRISAHRNHQISEILLDKCEFALV